MEQKVLVIATSFGDHQALVDAKLAEFDSNYRVVSANSSISANGGPRNPQNGVTVHLVTTVIVEGPPTAE